MNGVAVVGPPGDVGWSAGGAGVELCDCWLASVDCCSTGAGLADVSMGSISAINLDGETVEGAPPMSKGV